MKTRGETVEKYRAAFENGTEGLNYLKLCRIIALNCSEEDKIRCLTQEIDHIICGYMSSKRHSDNWDLPDKNE